jgi:DNA polymerase III subunit beta
MKVICNTDFLGRKLALVSRGVSPRSTIQILGGILLEAGEEVVGLSAMDMELSIQTSAPAEVEEKGRVVIPARIFNDVVRSLSKEDLTLVHDSSEGVVRLSAGRTCTGSGRTPPRTFRGCRSSTRRRPSR